MTVVLDACPVCRAALDGDERSCPSCRSELTVYRELATRSDELISAALAQLARDDSSLAREVALRLPQLVSDPGPRYHALLTQLALRDGNLDAARNHARQSGDEQSALLERLADLREGDSTGAHEQYNYALTAARGARYATAARHLAAGLETLPQDPLLWRLKLKVDLKRQAWAEVYDDLATLDRLGVRPAEFENIERLLPILPPPA